MIANQKARMWVYIGQTGIGLVLMVLVALRVIDQSVSDQIVAASAGLVMMLTGELARRNIGPKPAVIGADGVQRISDALDAYSKTEVVAVLDTTMSAATDAVEQTRRRLEAQLSR